MHSVCTKLVVLGIILFAPSMSNLSTGIVKADEESEQKLAIPDEASLEKAREEVQKLFASDFRSARNAAQQVTLAEKLLKLGEEVSNDPTTKYALLMDAKELATEAGHIELAMRTIDEIAESFLLDANATRWEIIDKNGRRVRSAEDARRMSEFAHSFFREIAGTADYPLAQKVAKLESTIALKSRDPKAIAESRADGKLVESLMERWNRYQNGLQSSEKENSQRDIGLFFAFDQRDWLKAVEYLKASDDKLLVQAAQGEESPPVEPQKQLALAELWHKIASSQKDLDRQFSLERSLYWYQEAVKGLTGIEKVRVDARLAEFELPIFEYEPKYLTDLEEFDVIGGPWGFAKFVKGVQNPVPIILGGKEAKKGLGVHPPSNGFSQVKYRLDGRFGTFISIVGLASDEGLTSSPVVFVVLGDGKPLWASNPLRKGQSIQTCAVDVSGINVLELRAACSGGHLHAHACWGDPYLMKARGLAPR